MDVLDKYIHINRVYGMLLCITSDWSRGILLTLYVTLNFFEGAGVWNFNLVFK